MKPCDEPYFNVYPTRCLRRQPLPQQRFPSNVMPANIPEPQLGQGGGDQMGRPGLLPAKGYDPTGFDLNQLKHEIETEEQRLADVVGAEEEILNTAPMKEGMDGSTPFWFTSPSVIFSPDYIFEFIPVKGMEENRLLNSVVRFSIYVFLITFLLLRKTTGIYLILIAMIATVIVKEMNKKPVSSSQKENYPPYMPYPPDPEGMEDSSSAPIRLANGADLVNVNRNGGRLPNGQASPIQGANHYEFSDPREFIARRAHQLTKTYLDNPENHNRKTKKDPFIPLTPKEGFTTYDASYYRPVNELTGELIQKRASQDTVQDPFCLDGRGYENLVGNSDNWRRRIYI